MHAKPGNRGARTNRKSDISSWVAVLASMGVLWAAAGSGCDTHTRPGANGDGGGDGPVVCLMASCQTSSDAGQAACHQPLGEPQPFGGCPPVFSDKSWKDSVCFLPATVREQECGTYRSRSFGFGTHSFTCFYDGTRETLVGATFNDDVASFCDHTSSMLTAGEVPAVVATCTPPVERTNACTPDDAGIEGGPAAAVWRDGDRGFSLSVRGSFTTVNESLAYDGATGVLSRVCRSLCYVDGGLAPAGTEVMGSATLSTSEKADLEARLATLPTTNEAQCALDQNAYELVVSHGGGTSTTYVDNLRGVGASTCAASPSAPPPPYVQYDAIASFRLFLDGLLD